MGWGTSSQLQKPRRTILRLGGINRQAEHLFSVTNQECNYCLPSSGWVHCLVPKSALPTEELRPFGSAPRPKTTAVVARRLVAGALGVRLSQEQREKERVQRKELQMARGERKKWVTVWGAVFHWRSTSSSF